MSIINHNVATTVTVADAYKITHAGMYPSGTTEIYSNFTPRSGKYAKRLEGSKPGVLFFGAQGFLHEYLEMWNCTFFNRNKEKVLDELATFFANSFGCFDRERWGQIHDLGYLPLKIKTLPEGTFVPYGVPVLTITNTHPDAAWLVNYVETAISAGLWKASTNATTALQYRLLFEKHAREDGTLSVMFTGHDFSYRGLTLHEYASQAGHLTCFLGTDTMPSVAYIDEYYYGENGLVGTSVPASEHSVMTLLGQKEEGEEAQFLRILEKFPQGIVSVVADSYDYWAFLNKLIVKHKELILARKPDQNGLCKVVIRPDSGDPTDIICGTAKPSAEFFDMRDDDEIRKELHKRVNCNGYFLANNKYWFAGSAHGHVCVQEVELTHEQEGSLMSLLRNFGGKKNQQGFIELNPFVGLIYGDSITLERATHILNSMANQKFAVSNVVFGIGSYTYTNCTRDTHGFALKATSAVVDGIRRSVKKEPKTDSGTKVSARGLLRVELENGTYVLRQDVSEEEEQGGCLRVVLENSQFFNHQSFADVRKNVQQVVEEMLACK